MAGKFYRVVSPFVVWEDGVPVQYNNDRTVLYTEDHPAVLANFGAFIEVVPLDGKKAPQATQLPAVPEATTAAPGETRTTSRSRAKK